MEILLQLFSKEELKELLTRNKDIMSLTKEEVREKIRYLKELNITSLRTVIKLNPFFLTRPIKDTKEVIHKLKEYEVNNIGKIIEKNPFILNKNAYEIDGFIISKIKSGTPVEECIKLLEEEPLRIE